VPWTVALPAVLVWAVAPSGSGDGFLWVFVAVSATVGMFHGAADASLARLQVPGTRAIRALPGGLGYWYLGLMGLTAALWALAPAAALGLFLVLTAWHWGSGDLPARGLALRSAAGLGRGLLVLGCALRVGGSEAVELFEALGVGAVSVSGVTAAGKLACAAAAGLTLLAVGASPPEEERSRGARVHWAVESVLLAVVLSALPVYAGLALYYGAFHSLRHLAVLGGLWRDHLGRVARGAARRREAVASLAIPLLVTLVILALAPGLAIAGGAPGVETMAVVFQALAVLTTPHAFATALIVRESRCIPSPGVVAQSAAGHGLRGRLAVRADGR